MQLQITTVKYSIESSNLSYINISPKAHKLSIYVVYLLPKDFAALISYL